MTNASDMCIDELLELRGRCKPRKYSFKKKAQCAVEFKLSTLLACMQEYARAGYAAYTMRELQEILRGHGYSVQDALLSQMLDCLEAKGHVERTASGFVQLTN